MIDPSQIADFCAAANAGVIDCPDLWHTSARGHSEKSMDWRLNMVIGVGALFLTLPAHADWHSRQYVDQFTDDRICRVEKQSPMTRSFVRGLTNTAITLHFYVENYNGEVRAGIRSEPEIPMSDVQIRVDQNPMMVLGIEHAPQDTPNTFLNSYSADAYLRPEATPEEREALEQAMTTTMDTIAGISSPYRAFRGAEAMTLLRQMVGADRVIFRMVGQNTALSTTGEFEPNSRFFRALGECGIDLDLPVSLSAPIESDPPVDDDYNALN